MLLLGSSLSFNFIKWDWVKRSVHFLRGPWLGLQMARKILQKNIQLIVPLQTSLIIVSWDPVRALDSNPNQKLLARFLITIMVTMDGTANGLNWFQTMELFSNVKLQDGLMVTLVIPLLEILLANLMFDVYLFKNYNSVDIFPLFVTFLVDFISLRQQFQVETNPSHQSMSK